MQTGRDQTGHSINQPTQHVPTDGACFVDHKQADAPRKDINAHRLQSAISSVMSLFRNEISCLFASRFTCNVAKGKISKARSVIKCASADGTDVKFVSCLLSGSTDIQYRLQLPTLFSSLKIAIVLYCFHAADPADRATLLPAFPCKIRMPVQNHVVPPCLS